jgi:hypothetical protein
MVRRGERRTITLGWLALTKRTACCLHEAAASAHAIVFRAISADRGRANFFPFLYFLSRDAAHAITCTLATKIGSLRLGKVDARHCPPWVYRDSASKTGRRIMVKLT